MRAVVRDRYGPPEVLRIGEVDRPVPAADEILVRVHATTVNRTDCGWRSGSPFFVRYFTGVRRPKWRVLGMEFAGEVELVGSAVTEFAVGDRVFGVMGHGANAEYLCVRATRAVAHMPSGTTFEEAASLCDGPCIALSCLRNVDVRDGKRIVVYGASGSVGTAAVQLARHLGAHVTAVANTKNLELVRSLGADEVIDYRSEDFTRSGPYDLILDLVAHRSVFAYRRALVRGGRYRCVGGSVSALLRVLTVGSLAGLLTGRRLGILLVRQGPAGFTPLADRCVAGDIDIRIDRTFGLDDVAEALTRVGEGRALGKVVVEVR